MGFLAVLELSELQGGSAEVLLVLFDANVAEGSFFLSGICDLLGYPSHRCRSKVNLVHQESRRRLNPASQPQVNQDHTYRNFGLGLGSSTVRSGAWRDSC